MVKVEWGTKRSCLGCGASFYDLRREPIVCPKCGAEFDPHVQNRPGRSRPAARSPVVSTGQGSTVNDDLRPLPEKLGPEENEEEAADNADTADQDVGDKGGEAAIEDVSELGEDKDDMFEVMDKVVEGKDEAD